MRAMPPEAIDLKDRPFPTARVTRAILGTEQSLGDWLLDTRSIRGCDARRARDALFLAGIAPSTRGADLLDAAARRLASALLRGVREASSRASLLETAGARCRDCGATLRAWKDELIYCPRCQKETPSDEPDPATIAKHEGEASATGTRHGRWRIGCALWSYAPWCGVLYPERTPAKERLRRYGERFTCVEGNSFFYAQPSADLLARWVDETPANFRFYPKFPRYVSHEGALAPRANDAVTFLDTLEPLRSRLGTVFLQLPPRVGSRSIDDLGRFFETVAPAARTRGIALAVEVRDDALIEGPAADRLDGTLRSHEVTRVLLDTRAVYQAGEDPQKEAPRPKPRLRCTPRRTTDHAILRYVGHPDLARNEVLLATWSTQLTAWLREGVDVTVFAHCPDERHSPHIARRIQALLEENRARIAALPWNELPPDAEQQSLF